MDSMKKQLRILIGSSAECYPFRFVQAFLDAGFWTVCAHQTVDIMMYRIHTEHPDILILNMRFLSMDFSRFIRELNALYRMDIIIVSDDRNTFLKNILERSDNPCTVLPDDPDQILQFVQRKYIKPDDSDSSDSSDRSRIRINTALHQTAVPIQLQGYRYLYTALKYACEELESGMSMQKLYSMVAEYHGSSVSAVEHAMRTAVSHCRLKQKTPTGETKKATVSFYINTVMEAFRTNTDIAF